MVQENGSKVVSGYAEGRRRIRSEGSGFDPNALSSLSCTSSTFCAGVTPPGWVWPEGREVIQSASYGLTYNGTGWNTPQMFDDCAAALSRIEYAADLVSIR